jgi:molybdate transport system substrate-binding protein
MLIVRNAVIAGLGWLIATVCLGAPLPALAGYPVAPDVVVFCEPTLQHAVGDVGALWQKATGVPVRVFTSPTPALLEQIAHHARDDVIIGEGDGNARIAAERSLIQPQTLQQFGRNRLVVAALDGNGGGSASAGGADKLADKLATVAGKAAVAIVDPWAAVAGADGKTALQSLGLWQAVSSKSVGVVGTADAAFLLAHGQVKLAVVYATDVAAHPDFTIAEGLPEAGYPPIVYWVALTAHSLSPNAAKFAAFLHEASARKRLAADGLEVSP